MFRSPTLRIVLLLAAMLSCVSLARADYEAGQTAWQAGRHAEALSQWREVARAGDGRAMLAIGRAYLHGLGVPQDYILAHMWLDLAVGRGSATAATERDAVAVNMHPQHIAEARERARAWLSGRGTDAPKAAAVPSAAAPSAVAGPPPPRAIREAQALMTALGYEPGLADGRWGARTGRAYAAFLRDAGLPPERMLTPDTLRALRAAAKGRNAAAATISPRRAPATQGKRARPAANMQRQRAEQTARQAGRPAEVLAKWREAARTGDGRSMLALGRAYVKGLGIPQDYVEAHKWLNLAAGLGNAEAAAERDAIAAKMTTEEQAEARKLARDWRSGDRADAPKAGIVSRAATPTTPSTPEGPPPPRAIREAQALMTALGYKPGAADGRWGPRTGKAYAAFMRDSGLPPRKMLTPDALRSLRIAAKQRNVTASAAPSRPAPATQRQAAPPPADLHRLVAAGDVDGVKGALAHGADANVQDGKGWTPLMHAADKGKKLMVPLLLKAGADPDLRLADGATALFIATVHGHLEIAAALLRVGASITLKGPKSQTAIDVMRTKYGGYYQARERGEDRSVLSILRAGITAADIVNFVRKKFDECGTFKTPWYGGEAYIRNSVVLGFDRTIIMRTQVFNMAHEKKEEFSSKVIWKKREAVKRVGVTREGVIVVYENNGRHKKLDLDVCSTSIRLAIAIELARALTDCYDEDNRGGCRRDTKPTDKYWMTWFSRVQ